MDNVIALHGVEREYRMGRTNITALRGVTAEFRRGEFTAIAGPSGSGKTTLLNLIGCIDKPDRGRVIVNGQDVTETPLHRLAGLRNRYFGFIFQTFNLIPVLSAYENVEFPVLLDGVPAGERRTRVESLLERVGLKDHRRHRPHELSGGQRQRVAIARALVATPLAVLADEPTANLDSRTGAEILDLMHELNESRGVTFLFSTHDPEIIRKARRVLAMHDGELRETRTSEAAPAAAAVASAAPAAHHGRAVEPAATLVPRSA
jgi:putative ABC transport system ATP-binding protein